MSDELNNKTLEQAFAELDELTARMQTEELTLEETFELYKKGLALVEACSSKIEKVECEIHKLNTTD